MSKLTVLIDQDQTSFTPGSLLKGAIHWHLDKAPQSLQLQLLWFTSGKGGTDVEVVETLDFSHSQTDGTAAFEFTLPDSPYSFSGKLISLHWALELVAEPDSLDSRTEFTLSPSGKEIVLPEIIVPKSKISLGNYKPK